MQREMGPVDASLEFMTEDVCKGHFDELGVSELKNIFQGRGGSGRNYEINSMIKGDTNSSTKAQLDLSLC